MPDVGALQCPACDAERAVGRALLRPGGRNHQREDCRMGIIGLLVVIILVILLLRLL